MSVVEFLGRTADLLVFHGNFPSDGEQQVQITLVPDGTGGLLCTGIQKLAQRVLYVLFTKKGSVAYRPDDGTNFLADAERGFWRTSADVFQSFTAAKLTMMRQLRTAEETTDPDDERIEDIVLTGVSLGVDSISLSFQLTSLAGEDYEFIAPINVLTQ